VAEQDALKALESTKVDGLPGHSLDVTGPDGPGKPTPRIRAVMVRRGEQTWFFKMMGPAGLVGDEGPAFEGFMKSVRFEK
jgi:hypothetical protein